MPKSTAFPKVLGLSVALAAVAALTLADLYRYKGIDKHIGEIEIDARYLPELTYTLNEPNLEEKLREKTGRNEFYVKDFEALGLGHALSFIPLPDAHLKSLNLGAMQDLETK